VKKVCDVEFPAVVIARLAPGTVANFAYEIPASPCGPAGPVAPVAPVKPCAPVDP
jgi:hypothetical protein